MSDMFAGQESAGLEVQTGSEKPLTDQERALLQRLLSDPFAYPQQFKTWLVAYLEGSDMVLARSSIQGLGDLLGSGGGQGVLGLLPAGLILPYGGAAAPVGAFLCNGAAYSRAGYKRLFDAIGTQFGTGDGSTTFNVPDLRRRVLYGVGASLSVGQSDGQAEASRDLAHHHYFGQTSDAGGGHNHSISGNTDSQGSHQHGHQTGAGYITTSGATTQLGGSGGSVMRGENYDSFVAAAGSHSHNVGGSTSSVGDHNHFVQGATSGGGLQDQPSFAVVGFIVNY